MKVRMKTRAAGPDGCWSPGSEHEVPGYHGQAMIDGGYAERIDLPVLVQPKRLAPPSPQAAFELAPGRPKPKRASR